MYPVHIDVELNSMGYSKANKDFLNKNSSNKRLTVNSSIETWPSAIGWDGIMIYINLITIPLSLVFTGILSEFGKDLYHFSKSKLRRVMNEKERIRFSETKINLGLKDYKITIICSDQEEFLYAIENIENLLRQVGKIDVDTIDGNNKKEIIMGVDEIK